MRMQIAKAEQSKHNQKWSISFDTFLGMSGRECLAGLTTSAALFATEDDAYAAGGRALDVVDQTGIWPNLCEPF